MILTKGMGRPIGIFMVDPCLSLYGRRVAMKGPSSEWVPTLWGFNRYREGRGGDSGEEDGVFRPHGIGDPSFTLTRMDS